MFLGAGSVMHGMNDEVDMRHYGGLSSAMPVTLVTFAMGYLAIIGFPGPFPASARRTRSSRRPSPTTSWLFGSAALLGAGITAFYMTRLMLMTFFGGGAGARASHPHESPLVMTVPAVVLAVGSA